MASLSYDVSLICDCPAMNASCEDCDLNMPASAREKPSLFFSFQELKRRPIRINSADFGIHPAQRQHNFAQVILGQASKKLGTFLGPRQPEHTFWGKRSNIGTDCGRLKVIHVQKPMNRLKGARRVLPQERNPLCPNEQSVIVIRSINQLHTEPRFEPEFLEERPT
ncbi:hypothetical protein J7443_11495 [Tropicibacter sp. R15_0]|uniref:hypothetical protein n=1 Tax=Tropicibacter sp. R15_0 TaxID=2821101 RepID=UPI001AD9A4B5|nr:hypothetical protein [Tropicibacter sp. R15_0]MBO9465856.1 hypothetical protein [Tropicibacter sp. R15_0]